MGIQDLVIWTSGICVKSVTIWCRFNPFYVFIFETCGRGWSILCRGEALGVAETCGGVILLDVVSKAKSHKITVPWARPIFERDKFLEGPYPYFSKPTFEL